MTSIMTNASAMTALQSLQSTNKALETTQGRISTGYRVSQASDNAAYWSIATTMRSDNKALSTVQDALGLGAAKVDTAYTAMNSALDVVDEIKAKLVAASEPGVDKSKIQSEIKALQDQLKSIGQASFSGENWLTVDSSNLDAADTAITKSIVSSFTRGADNAVSVTTIDITLATGAVDLEDRTTNALFDTNATASEKIGILDRQYSVDNGADPAVAVAYTIIELDITKAGVDDTVLKNMISVMDGAHQALTTAAADLGAVKKRIDLQSTFVKNLMDTIDRGVGTLVDADMNEESTKLQALQVQQQLGIQSLSIANTSAQGVLSLFRS